MFADVLEKSQDQAIAELERRADADQCADPWIAGRRRRLRGLLHEVIGVLRGGGDDEAKYWLAPFGDLTRQVRERD
jgi:hypothetical protein